MQSYSSKLPAKTKPLPHYSNPPSFISPVSPSQSLVSLSLAPLLSPSPQVLLIINYVIIPMR